MAQTGLREIVALVLECDPKFLKRDTVLGDLENYDSVNILSLVISLDDELGIKLDPVPRAIADRSCGVQRAAVYQRRRPERTAGW